MKNINKLLSFLLAGLLICGALASCGDSDSGSDRNEDDDDRIGSIFGDDDDKDNDDNGNAVTTDGKGGSETPDHSHDWSDWVTVTEPTCSEEGLSSRSCSCGATETQPIAKVEHTEGEWVVVTKPTTTSSGKQALLCAVCGEQISERVFEMDAEWVFETDKLGYCNGYASVNGDYRDVILDSYGDVAYATADGEEIEIYGNGYFISKLNGVQYLKKADGAVVCSTTSLGIKGFGLTENTTDYTQFLSDGYIFAYNIVETFADSVTQVGILGTDGNWIVPLSEDNPILTYGIPYFDKFYTQHWHHYVGDGILALKHYDAPYDVVLYNIKDNVICELTSNQTLSYDTDYLITKASFNNGVAYVSSGTTVYKFYSNGKITRTNLETQFHDVCMDESGNYYTVTSSSICLNGESYVELGFNVADAAWIGDAWLTLIKNPNGTYYYTYMKLDGELLFEPVQTEAVYICDVSGVSVGELYSDGTKLVIDQTGKVLYTSTNPKAEIYLNKGVVCEQVKGAFSSTETYTFLK